MGVMLEDDRSESILAKTRELAASNGLFGRQSSISQLLESFENVKMGLGEICLIPGLSGVGKTSLARVLAKPAREHNGFFLEGKFNQYDQNMPFVAWRQALVQFCQTVLKEDEIQRQKWKDAIQKAVGGNGQLLLDLVPEFEQLIGKQLPLTSISAQEARHRFTGVFIALLQVICRPEHPLVLFLDDWQWADAASMHLLSCLQVGADLNYVLILTAYRHDEVDDDHLWTSTINDLMHRGVEVCKVPLHDLNLDELSSLIQFELDRDRDESQTLAKRIHEKTGGNPFFSHALLQLIQTTNHSKLKSLGDQDVTDRLELPDEIVGFFRDRVQEMSPLCQKVLVNAACLGNRFELNSLSIISDLPRSECQCLLSAAEPELVIRLSPSDTGDKSNKLSEVWYQFVHDRVQQAAYGFISREELPRVRLDVAHKLMEWMDDEQLGERICEVAEHLNAGSDYLENYEDVFHGFQLNVLAARKARAATAYRSALLYHRAARQFLEHPAYEDLIWREHHDLAISLLREQAETEFLEGSREIAEQCLRRAVERGADAIEKAETLGMLIVQYTLTANYRAAITTGREALAHLKITLPEGKYEEARDAEIAKTRGLLSGRTAEDLAAAEPAEDDWAKLAAKILITMGPPCYRSDQQLWSVIVPKVVNLSLEYGYLPEIGYSYTALAGLLGWVDNDYELGNLLGKTAELAMERQEVSPADKTVFYLMEGSSARHWFDHLAKSSKDYQEAFRIGSQFGNLQYAAYAFGHNMYCRFFQGVPLSQLIQETESSLAFSRTRHNQWAIDLLRGGVSLFECLRRFEQGWANQHDWETQYFHDLEEHNNMQVTCIFKVIKTTQSLLMGDYQQAYLLAEESAELISMVGTQGLLPWSEHVFARLLAISGLYETGDSEQQHKWRSELDRILDQLEIWKHHGPDNYEHKYSLACGEIARLEKRYVDAAEHYDQAINGAIKGGFIQWAGYANERASSLWRLLGEGSFAQAYWQQAYECAEQWEAGSIQFRLLGKRRDDIHANMRTSIFHDADSNLEKRLASLIERHLASSQKQAKIVSKVRNYAEAAEKANELAHAADSLRADVAERRKLTRELRKQHDLQANLNEHLEARVQERTIELARAEKRFRSLLESAPFPMLMVGPDKRLILVNIAAEIGFGYHRDELVGQDLNVLIAERCHGQLPLPDAFADFASNNPRLGSQQELFAVRQNGKEFPIEMGVGSVKMDEGNCLLLAVVDISTRKEMEEGLRRANDALEKSNVDLQQFAYVASHDLQTPLRGIAGFACFLEEDYGELLDKQGKDYIARIIEGAKRMSVLVNDLLGLSRIDAKAVSFKPTELSDVVEEVIQLLQVSIVETNASIHYQALPSIVVDRGQITQVIQNLVNNAIKYKRQDLDPQIRVSASLENSVWTIGVHDNGIGIPSRHQEKIFDIFRRLHTEKEIPGTGIGLAVCRRIVARHGGDIWVTSEKGQGSTFYFTIPEIS